MSLTRAVQHLKRARSLRAAGFAWLGLLTGAHRPATSASPFLTAALLLLIVAGPVAVRIMRTLGQSAEPLPKHSTDRSGLLIDSAITAVLAATLALFGAWIAAVLAALAVSLESPHIPFPAGGLSTRTQTYLSVTVTGVVLPLSGASLSGELTVAAIAVLMLTVPLALIDLPDAFAGASATAGQRFARALLALAGLTGSTIVAGLGTPLGLGLDRSLLVAAPGALLVLASLISLLDPRVNRRTRRVEALTRVAAVVVLSAAVFVAYWQ